MKTRLGRFVVCRRNTFLRRLGRLVPSHRIAVCVASLRQCRVEVLVNDVAQLPLTFGAPYYSGSTITGEGLVTIPDNAAIRLRVAGPYYRHLWMEGGGAGSRAFLTVIKIS